MTPTVVPWRALLPTLGLLVAIGPHDLHAQITLSTASDRSALRSWFLLLADAQFYRPTADVIDCAGLIRHALREALRPHSAEWLRHARLPFPRVAPEIVARPRASGDSLPLFLVRTGPARYAEFADARTIVTLNADRVAREVAGARPGDLLYFHQPASTQPDHLMIYVGSSARPDDRRDWIVYHTGPDGEDPGEMRKVAAADLLRHPSARWRPVNTNPHFVGVFRLHLLR